MAAEPGQEFAIEDRGGLLASVSNRIVQLHKQFYGKGPDKAKTYYHDDIVVVVLRGGFSRVEETLHQAGKAHAVIGQRMELQEAVQDAFKRAVSELVGREVIAFMSGSHQHPDVMAEIFLLAPRDGGGAGEPAERG